MVSQCESTAVSTPSAHCPSATVPCTFSSPLADSATRYTHIRIDVVHYCEREVELSAKRKRRSFFDRNGESIDAPAVRLELLMCSVRSSQKLGAMTRSLRIPYMTREACRADLARTVSAMPNLRYVDLPTGVFRDDPLCHALKQELMARCPDLRRFSYAQGSEGSFSRLAQSPVWPNLEVLEVCGLLIESHVLRRVLGEYSRLRELTLDGLDWLEDSALAPNDSLNAFPTVERLTLRNDRNITAAGLTVLLMSNGHRHALKHLTLSSTGVLPHSLHQILAVAPHLRSLSYIQQVSRSLPLEPVVPDLTSASLTTLHFEITPDENLSTAVSVTSSHYQYLRCSLRSNALPALRELYVRDADFAESLLRHLPHNQPQDGRSGELLNSSDVTSLSQPLNIYSKGLEEMEWTFTAYDPSSSLDLAQTRRPRPVSFFDAHLGPSWGGDARKSVLVGNGFGGFLAVPAEADQPRDSRYKRESRQDLWR